MFRFRLIPVLLMLLILFPALIPSIVYASSNHWNWDNTLSRGNDLNGIWGTSSNNVYAVGSGGTILHYNGTTWSRMASGITTHLTAIWGSSANDIFTVGHAGVILHYDGTAWSRMESGTTNDLSAIWGTASNNVYVVGWSQYVFHFDGSSWSMISHGFSGCLLSIWGTDSNNIYAVGWSSPGYVGSVLRYNGTVWMVMANDIGDLLGCIWGTSDNDIYVTDAGSGQPMLHYDGTSWSQVSGITRMLRIWGLSKSDIWASGYGTIYHYNGLSWTQRVEPNPDPSILGIWGSSTADIFMVGSWGTIFHHNMYLTTMNGGDTTSLTKIWGSSPSDVYAVGSYGTIIHFDGSRWVTERSGSYGEGMMSVWGLSSNDVYAVGHSAYIHHYNGVSWTSTGNGESSYDIWGSSSTDIVSVGGGGRIWRYNGSNWTVTSPYPSHIYYGVWGSSANDIFAVGAAGTIVHYDGTNWTVMNSGVTHDLRDVWGTSGSNVYVVGTAPGGAGGIVLHYDGNSWQTVVSDPNYILNGISGTAANNIFVVGGQGGGDNVVYHYDGNTWSLITSSLGRTLNGVWCDKNDTFICGYLGTIYHQATAEVSTNDATNIAKTSAILNGNVISLGTASNCNVTFQWGRSSESYTEETSIQTLTTVDNFTANLSSLSPNTKYYFIAKAVGDGTSYGEEKSFTTDALSSPDISVNPSIINFDPVVVGSSSTTQIIMITDNGTSDLSIGPIKLSGINSNQFTIVSDNASNQTIGPGSSKGVSVTFNPTKMGAKTATLSIPSNSPTNNPATVALVGLATKKPPIPVPSSTGKGMVTFDVIEGALIQGLTQIAEATLPVSGKPPLNFYYGFFGFTVRGVDPGGSVTITITCPDNIPTNCQFWKYNNGWVNVTSLVGDNDGDNVITLTLTDGSFEDADGRVNGEIRDPGGIGLPIQATAIDIVPTQLGLSTMVSDTPHGGSMPTTISAPVQLPNIYVQQAAISTSEVTPADTVSITAYVTNKGGVNGQANIRLSINGAEEESKGISVDSGRTIPVTFTVQKSQPGIYNVTVNNIPAGSFTVSDNSTILYISITCLFLALVLGMIMLYRKLIL